MLILLKLRQKNSQTSMTKKSLKSYKEDSRKMVLERIPTSSGEAAVVPDVPQMWRNICVRGSVTWRLYLPICEWSNVTDQGSWPPQSIEIDQRQEIQEGFIGVPAAAEGNKNK